MSPLSLNILYLIQLAGVPVGLFAFGHAVLQRADAYTAADRMTKPAWLGITGGGAAAMILFGALGGPGTGMLFWLAGLVAVLIYIVDVRPKVTEVQKGSSW